MSRRQVTLFLPEPMASAVDAVRCVVDPVQHALIPAHVTLCREAELEHVADLTGIVERLQDAAVHLAFDPPMELEDGCILMRATGETGEYDNLRQAILGPACGNHGAHITLLHPRNARARNVDLTSVGFAEGLSTMRFEGISVIEQQDPATPWRSVGGHEVYMGQAQPRPWRSP